MKSLYKSAYLLRRTVLFETIKTHCVRSTASASVDYKDARPFREIPGPKGKYNIPLIGAMYHFKPHTDVTFETMYRLYDRLLDQYGSLVRIRLGQWTVLVEDPADIEVIMKNEGKYPQRMLFQIHLQFCERSGAAKTIGDLQGEEWQKFRSPLNPRLLRAKSAQYYLSKQNEVADDLVARMKKPFSAEEMLDIFYRYACESISVVTYNKRLGYLDPDIESHPEKLEALADIRSLLTLLNESLQYPPFAIKYLPLKLKKRYFDTAGRIFRKTTDYYKEAIEDIRRRQTENALPTDEHNFMLSLMLSEKLTAEKMSAIATSLYIAGTDSTAQNLQIALYHLATNPAKQLKLYEEINDNIGRHGPLTEQALSSMKYLVASVRESFRLVYPTSTGTQRYLPNDVVLQGYRIPAGTSILMMNQKTVKNPKYFPEPDSYIPDRWLRDEDGKRETLIPTSAMLPFGFGPRMCIGKRFAEQEIYLAVTKILQNFEVSLEEDHGEVEIQYTPFAGPKDPIKFVFTERK